MLSHPDVERDSFAKTQRIASLRIAQLVHDGEATRILLRENYSFSIFGGEYFGFAYFPKGLDEREFKPFWLKGNGSNYLALSDGWFAVRVVGDDFG